MDQSRQSRSVALMLRAVGVIVAVLLTAFTVPVWGDTSKQLGPAARGSCKTNWLLEGKVGLSTHYFPLKPEQRNDMANAFQVERVAEQAAEAGASWLLFTVHHQPWIMLAPNATLDRLLGNSNYTSSRDVPLELHQQLLRYNIRLMLYVNLRLDPQSAASEEVRKAMGGWPPNDRVIENIASVYREFSLRYGDRVSGWWVDAAGLKEYRASPDRERWFKVIGDALRAGNPEALVTFNPGVTVRRYTGSDDYTAGESVGLDSVPEGRWMDRAQWHLWTFLGGWWESGGTRFSDDELERFVAQVTSHGGALTFEVGTSGINWEGRSVKGQGGVRKVTPHVGYIDPKQIEQIKAVMKHRQPAPIDQLTNCAN